MDTRHYRTVAETVSGTPAVDGAGVKLVRVLGPKTTERFDPFLMLDAFDSENPADYTKGFPWHPHRGIETVTFLIRGRIDHGDSLGNSGTIGSGDCQWMTAGSGIIHQEMPKAASRILGLQLWINMPAAHKMDDPAYHDITADMVPEINENGATVRIIGGSLNGTDGAFRGTYVDALLLDVALQPGAGIDIPVDELDTVFVYSMEGKVSFDPKSLEPKTYIEYRKAVRLENGNLVRLTASTSESARQVLFAAKPLKEPIAWGGPIVMNTREELDTAFMELERETFIRHR